MNAERLLRLAEHLETVVALQPATFDMASWQDRNECGATCCAFAHACSIPEFREAGLHMAIFPEDEDPIPWFGNAAGFDAAASFFEIDEIQARHLFADESYPDVVTPIDVAARIRELVAGKAVGA